MVKNDSSPILCSECLHPVREGANRCGSCGIVLHAFKRRILQVAALVSAVLVVVPLWQIAVTTSDLLKTKVDFEVEPAACGQQGILVSFVNFESDRFLEWSDVRLQSVNGVEVDEAMVFRPGQPRHIPPLTSEPLEFLRQSNAVPTDGDVCSNGCTMVVRLTAKEADGRRATTATASCTWTPNQPVLD